MVTMFLLVPLPRALSQYTRHLTRVTSSYNFSENSTVVLHRREEVVGNERGQAQVAEEQVAQVGAEQPLVLVVEAVPGRLAPAPARERAVDCGAARAACFAAHPRTFTFNGY